MMVIIVIIRVVVENANVGKKCGYKIKLQEVEK